ncbi:Fc.00g071040.m01.CDS01 [Cosmosporella sp. VM-42]
MPLVVPGINSTGGDKNEEWMNKLVGKKISDEESSETVFCKRDLPEETRIIEPGTMVTKDFKENRLNVHLKEDGTVSHVAHG